jgi:hypothetical protein
MPIPHIFHHIVHTNIWPCLFSRPQTNKGKYLYGKCGGKCVENVWKRCGRGTKYMQNMHRRGMEESSNNNKEILE